MTPDDSKFLAKVRGRAKHHEDCYAGIGCVYGEEAREDVNSLIAMVESRDKEIVFLALDALAALSKYTATAAEGYRVAPHMLASDIHHLGRERDRLRKQVEAAREALDRCLGFAFSDYYARSGLREIDRLEREGA